MGRLQLYLTRYRFTSPKNAVLYPQYEELILAINKVNVNYLSDLILFYSYDLPPKNLVGHSERLIGERKTSRSAMQNLIQAGLVDLRCMPDVLISDDGDYEKSIGQINFSEMWRIDPVTANGKVIVEIIENREEIFS
ncbi:hypothetical protein FEK30_05010 [Picosynechococcus sp. PCC 11901]|uniref:hypothetical protein n=1 Tax=Picosynechococcus sp. PCC 11901 TaxID=2579791 RepID=UPI0010FC0301|nr:hypothetical protein [Picosynechococcus sp. PCC 11901]QCS48845.1 hypothetical protein FEK30_05010 [Picosynechococcus sp. PCC 11901]